MTTERFSAQWAGYLLPVFTGTHTVRVESDAGVEVILDGVKVIDYLSSTDPVEASALVQLTEAVVAPIEISYQHGVGNAYLRLYWSSTSYSDTLIPPENLLFPTNILTPDQTVYVESSAESAESIVCAPSVIFYPDRQTLFSGLDSLEHTHSAVQLGVVHSHNASSTNGSGAGWGVHDASIILPALRKRDGDCSIPATHARAGILNTVFFHTKDRFGNLRRHPGASSSISGYLETRPEHTPLHFEYLGRIGGVYRVGFNPKSASMTLTDRIEMVVEINNERITQTILLTIKPGSVSAPHCLVYGPNLNRAFAGDRGYFWSGTRADYPITFRNPQNCHVFFIGSCSHEIQKILEHLKIWRPGKNFRLCFCAGICRTID